MYPSMRKSLKTVSHIVGVGMLCLFFAFHTFAGDTGWLAKKEIERDILLVKAELAQLRAALQQEAQAIRGEASHAIRFVASKVEVIPTSCARAC